MQTAIMWQKTVIRIQQLYWQQQQQHRKQQQQKHNIAHYNHRWLRYIFYDGVFVISDWSDTMNDSKERNTVYWLQQHVMT